MQNTNNTFNNFPTSFEQYFDNKPEGMSFYQYFFSIINPNRFSYRVMGFIYLIIRLCKTDGWSMAFIGTIAYMANMSPRTVQRLLRKLVAIGLLEERIEGNHRRYRVNQTNFDLLLSKYKGNNIIQDFYDEQITQDYYIENEIVTPDVTPEFPESPFDLIDYEANFEPTLRDCNNSKISLSHQKDDLSISDSSILESDKTEPLITLDPIEVEIKQEFEALTGKPLNLKKNRKPLAELKEIAKQAKDIVKLAFRNIANHIAETGTKVYNLGYVLTAVKNLMRPKASPTTPRDYAPASEQDKAYASIGGNTSSSSVQEPTTLQQTQELEQARSIRQTCDENPSLRSELYNNLDEAEKKQLIQEEISYLKTQPIWQKLHPNFPALDMGFAVHYAIEKIKNFLVLEYLDYQQDLASQLSG